MSLVSRDTMTVLRSMEGCPGIPGYHVLRDWGGSIWGEVPWMSLVSQDSMY